ncbi:MAG: CocE/NonD family hydrolase [Siphonobacter sp.]
MRHFILSFFFIFSFTNTYAQVAWVKENYQKYEFKIPMRDGIKLHTAVYVPKDASASNQYPFLMQRTCYAVEPYGVDKYPSKLGPNSFLMKDKYIFVYQDVRGRYMSEGTWTTMTPHIPNKTKPTEVDEASDMYDTIEWLLKNVPNNNGRVGQWGISYPGYYTTASSLSNHPALKASSPQAPIADFFFDDFHHNGAFVEHYFSTYPLFGIQTGGPTDKHWWVSKMVNLGTPDGFEFYQNLGPLKNGDTYYADNFYWQETVNHPNYDEFWQKRGILQHLKNVTSNYMFVGGWFDAEDLYGPLNSYKTIEKNNPKAYNTLVMGPFGHGRWSQETGHTMHSNIYFGDSVATFYQKNIETTFFKHFLKGPGDGKTGLPEAYLFDTGSKQWKQFDKWPATQARKVDFYLVENGDLSQTKPVKAGFREYVSDPNKPVPHSEDYQGMTGFTPFNYMSEDQRFAGRRTDVLVYETPVLEQDMTLGGEITAKLKIATTGSDADFFVKLIDVYPDNEKNNPYMTDKKVALGGYQQMVRSEIMRARFRNSFEKPEALKPGQKTDVTFRLQDVLHTFKKGHRIMIQIQSTAFPLFDRNPQKFVPNIYKAEASDFIKATHKIFNDSAIEVQIIE